MRTDQRYKLYPAQILLLVLALTGSRDTHERLLAGRGSRRNDQSAADGELRLERDGHRGAAGGDENRIIWCVLRPPERAIGVEDVDVVERERLHAACRESDQRFVTLHGIDLAGDS